MPGEDHRDVEGVAGGDNLVVADGRVMFVDPAKAAADSGPVSRGYTEEIEHFAWCIRNNAPDQPRCRAEVALGDAVIALACNVAIENSFQGKGGYLQFKEEWYDIDKDETPDGSRFFSFWC